MDHGAFHELIANYQNRITVDVGTGDGLCVYKCAQSNPQRLFIGLDANRRPLEKISEKIYRRPARGGVANALFLQAAVENLPEELNGIASEILVQFPWGSLLRGVAAGDEVVMRNLRRICLPQALLHVTLGIDLEKDSREWERLGLPAISIAYVSTVLAAGYLKAGLRIVETKQISMGDVDELHTSWARRLQGSSSRSLMVITARAMDSR